MYEELRPWGGFRDLHEEPGDPGFKIKRIEVSPGKRLSLQRHRHRSEHWFVVQGRGLLTLGHDEIPLERGTAANIPLGAIHRLTNTGDELLVVIEVQQGSYLGEDDIERLADDFGRS